MKKVIISGATSMIGIALIETCIKHKTKVIAIVRENSANLYRIPESEYIEIIECNLENIALLDKKIKDKGFDAFFHLGWSHTDKESRKKPQLQVENISSSIEAVKIAQKLKCRKFIGAGSQAEYGIHYSKKTAPDSPINPQDAYGICKYAAGKLCEQEANRCNMDFIWVRIFSIYGKYELSNTLISLTIPRLLNGEHCKFSEALHEWDYLYSSDAGNAFYLIGEKVTGSQIYCLGSGVSKPLKEYITIIRDLIDPSQDLGFGELKLSSKPCSMCADITSLQKDTGWMPLITFEEGIQKEIDRYKTNNMFHKYN